MNIVLVIDQFDDGNNGTTVTARRFASELRKLGHKVTVLAGGEAAPNKVCTPWHKIPFFEKLIESQGMKFAKPKDYAYYEAFRDADIVHFYMPFRFCRRGEELARQLQIPTVAAFHVQPENITSSIGMGRRKSVNRFLYWWFYHVFYNRFHTIHCPSAFIAGQLKDHGYEAELSVISNGVDDVFVPNPQQKAKRGDDGVLKVLMIGRLSKEKRQDLIIEAVKKSKYSDRIQLYFAGRGPKESDYRHLSKGLSHPPVFGFYSTADLVDLINSCDLYVHASDAEIEGISCMEALSCGLVPVISDSKLSATAQFALDKRSLFRAGDASDLARQMDYWFDHPEERSAMEGLYTQKGEDMRVSRCVRQAEAMYQKEIRDFRSRGYKRPEETALRSITHPDADRMVKKYKKHSPVGRRLTAGFTNVLAVILSFIDTVFLGMTVKGRERLDKVEGGAVTVCNHVHPMDCTMVKVALFPKFIRFISLRRNLELPFVGWLLRACGALPLPEHPIRLARLQKEIEKGISLGEWIHYYPEGMLVKYGKGLRPFHPGAFLTAVRTGCPVVPLRVTYQKPHGLRKLWRRKPFLEITVKTPLYADQTLPQKLAVQELMYRTMLEMGREEQNLSFQQVPEPVPVEAPIAETIH